MKTVIAYDRVEKSLHIYENGILVSSDYGANSAMLANALLIAVRNVEGKVVVEKVEKGSLTVYVVRGVRLWG